MGEYIKKPHQLNNVTFNRSTKQKRKAGTSQGAVFKARMVRALLRAVSRGNQAQTDVHVCVCLAAKAFQQHLIIFH